MIAASLFLVFCCVCSVLAAPYGSYGSYGGMATSSPGGGGGPVAPVYNTTADISVLQYALTLENLEAAFYVNILNQHSVADFVAIGLTQRDYDTMTAVRDHEATHVATLSAAITGLGATPVPPCIYNFPMTDVKSIVAIARALETVGVSAYIFEAAEISNPAYLTVATSIVTVEARHAAFFNYISGKSVASAPFDISLDRRQVITLASPFITSCPYTLPTPFPTLTITPTSGVAGISIAVSASGVSLASGVNCAFITGYGQNFLVAVANGACAAPAALAGEVYVVLTSAKTIAALNDGNTLAGPAMFAVPSKGDLK